MTNKLMYIPNENKQNYPFYRLKSVVKTLDTQFNEPTNQNSRKVKLTNRKTLLETSVINSPMNPPFLCGYS